MLLDEEEEQKATDQPEEGDSLLEEEEQKIADQLAEEELIVVEGEFVISVLGKVNMLLSIQPLVCESEGH